MDVLLLAMMLPIFSPFVGCGVVLLSVFVLGSENLPCVLARNFLCGGKRIDLAVARSCAMDGWCVVVCVFCCVLPPCLMSIYVGSSSLPKYLCLSLTLP